LGGVWAKQIPEQQINTATITTEQRFSIYFPRPPTVTTGRFDTFSPGQPFSRFKYRIDFTLPQTGTG
jgi:hypothetical protein